MRFEGASPQAIAAGSISLSQLANMATGSLIYRKTAGSGAPEVQTLAALKTDLLAGDVKVTGGLRATGALTAPAGLAVDIYSDGANGIVQAYNSTSAAYAALFLKGNPINFYPNGGSLMFSVTTTGVATAGTLTSSGATSGIGYAAGAGGTVAQATSKSTGVTLNKVCGQITMNAAALATATGVAFTVTNSTVAATDTIDLVLASGNATAGTYNYQIDKVSAGSFVIWAKNMSAGSLSEALVFNYSVKKAVIA